MGNVFHQRFNLIVNEKLLNEVAKLVGKDPKNVTEEDINKVVYETVLSKE